MKRRLSLQRTTRPRTRPDLIAVPIRVVPGAVAQDLQAHQAIDRATDRSVTARINAVTDRNVTRRDQITDRLVQNRIMRDQVRDVRGRRIVIKPDRLKDVEDAIKAADLAVTGRETVDHIASLPDVDSTTIPCRRDIILVVITTVIWDRLRDIAVTGMQITGLVDTLLDMDTPITRCRHDIAITIIWGRHRDIAVMPMEIMAHIGTLLDTDSPITQCRHDITITVIWGRHRDIAVMPMEIMAHIDTSLDMDSPITQCRHVIITMVTWDHLGDIAEVMDMEATVHIDSLLIGAEITVGIASFRVVNHTGNSRLQFIDTNVISAIISDVPDTVLDEATEGHAADLPDSRIDQTLDLDHNALHPIATSLVRRDVGLAETILDRGGALPNVANVLNSGLDQADLAVVDPILVRRNADLVATILMPDAEGALQKVTVARISAQA